MPHHKDGRRIKGLFKVLGKRVQVVVGFVQPLIATPEGVAAPVWGSVRGGHGPAIGRASHRRWSPVLIHFVGVEGIMRCPWIPATVAGICGSICQA